MDDNTCANISLKKSVLIITCSLLFLSLPFPVLWPSTVCSGKVSIFDNHSKTKYVFCLTKWLIIGGLKGVKGTLIGCILLYLVQTQPLMPKLIDVNV